MANTDLEVEQLNLDYEVPEIQDPSSEEVAKWSAQWAANATNKPVAVTDAGYYITSLNGFPGSFIKYVNKWLTSDDLLRLMEGKEDRIVEVRESLAYCEPEREPIVVSGIAYGTISYQKGRSARTPINEIFNPKGLSVVESELATETMQTFYAESMNLWVQLANKLD